VTDISGEVIETIQISECTQPANNAIGHEEEGLILQYIELFCQNMEQKFAAASNRVGRLNSQAMKTVRQSRCINIQKFHVFYGLLYPKFLQDTPDVLNRAAVELNNFMIPETWWWERSVDIPTQSARLALWRMWFCISRWRRMCWICIEPSTPCSRYTRGAVRMGSPEDRTLSSYG
jgi:hypothetical protein